MASRGLSPDAALGVRLGAICSRNRYTTDPGPVVDELREAAGSRTDILAAEVGSWIGFYDSEVTHMLAEGLRAGFADLDLQPGIDLGRKRRDTPWHSTPGTPH